MCIYCKYSWELIEPMIFFLLEMYINVDERPKAELCQIRVRKTEKNH